MSIIPYINHNVQELVAYQPGKPISETARELGLEESRIVKLASNENALGPSPKAVQAMQKAADGMHIYPDGASYELRCKIAAKHHVQFEQTVVGNGSSELIELLCHACLHPGLELVAAQYSFAMYALMGKLFDAQYVEVPNKEDWSHDLQAMLAAITPQTRLVFITNPTNPLGTMVGQEEMDAFMAAVPKHVIVVFDEAYIEFAGKSVDSLKYLRDGHHVAILRTFSKAYGLAGARVGYALTTLEIADLLNKARSPFNVNLMAQVAAGAALDDSVHLERSVQMVRDGRQQYYEALDAWGVTYIPSHGNFIMVNVGQGHQVYEAMLARGVILRPMGGYGLPNYVRITIGTHKENERCLCALKEVLGL